MTIKNEFLEQSDTPERESAPTLSFRFCFLFLIVFISIPFARAETLSENIDPISPPEESSSASSSQDVNMSNSLEHSDTSSHIWENPAEIARLSDQWLSQTDDNIAVNSAAGVDKKSSHSHIRETPAEIDKLSDQWLKQANGDMAVNSVEADKKPPDLLIAKSPTTDTSRQLWQARIRASEDRKPSQSKKEIRQIIRQIDSVEFKPKDQTPEPLIAVEPVQEAEPNEISPDSDTEMSQEQEPKLSDGQITDQTLQTFKSLSQQPGQLQNPFELAEILFSSHCLKEAAKCYQESLNRMATNEADQLADKAWVLFQIGNCLQNIDPPTSMQMYGQLIAEYPDSPWADLAKAKSKLVDWYQQENPEELVAENQVLKKEYPKSE